VFPGDWDTAANPRAISTAFCPAIVVTRGVRPALRFSFFSLAAFGDRGTGVDFFLGAGGCAEGVTSEMSSSDSRGAPEDVVTAAARLEITCLQSKGAMVDD
jgi:hypothetical protein